MSDIFVQVGHFNHLAGNTIAEGVWPPINASMLKQAVNHQHEEAREMAAAHDDLIHFTGEPGSDEHVKLVAEVADAAIDSIYVACNVLHALGVYGMPLFEAVHGANMAKLQFDEVTGLVNVIRNADGKIQKPEGWTAPDHTNDIKLTWSMAKLPSEVLLRFRDLLNGN